MSFIRAKEIPPRSGNWYDYEVMTIHEGRNVRQKVIRYLVLLRYVAINDICNHIFLLRCLGDES